MIIIIIMRILSFLLFLFLNHHNIESQKHSLEMAQKGDVYQY